MKIISPDKRCASAFNKLCFAVTGKKLSVVSNDDGVSDLLLIGSDAVNGVVHDLIMSGKLDSLNIRYGTDDFRILSLEDDNRTILILAGGRTRADYYAVYDYFERYCNCRYFWDGDVIPKRAELPVRGLDYQHRFQLRYRGLRYFAHRSLHRFQAEHWSLPEWKNELEYLLKKKFNLFMLRIGHDDIFQKTFPELVDYPPEDRQDPDAIDRSYDDRTCFWGLKERARLRREIIRHAKKLDLFHPVDMGPMTHWYSRTPVDFLKKEQPPLLSQSTAGYNEQTGLCWDLTIDRNIENYWKLTKAELKYYDTPDFFHIIGLAERKFGERRQNLQMKLYAYRRFIRKLREEYPHAPLLIASWDLMLEWDAEEVRQLVSEFDPENTIILDYTEDLQYRHNDFLQWGLPHNFPYIFGIFQGVERYSGSAFDFEYTERNFAHTVNDPCCKGMIMWSEMSHAHTMLHEYLAKRSAGMPFSVAEFCRDRYGKNAGKMEAVWKRLEKEFAENSFHRTLLIFDDTFNLLMHLGEMYQDHTDSSMQEQFRRMQEMRPRLTGIYSALAEVIRNGADERTRRDVLDIARTHLMSDMLREFADVMYDLGLWRSGAEKKPSGDRFVQLTRMFHQLLATDGEYSLLKSLERLAKVHPLNPASEETLKGNAENFYCRTYITELALGIYIPEAEFWRDWIAASGRSDRETKEEFDKAAAVIRDAFYAKPLAAYRTSPEDLADVLEKLETVGSVQNRER